MPRKRTAATAKANGTSTSSRTQARSTGATVPYIARQRPQATPLSDSPSPATTAAAPEPPSAPIHHPPPDTTPQWERHDPRHPLSAMGPELSQLDIGGMPQPYGPMVRPEQLQEIPMDWPEPAEVLNKYLIDYFRKNGFHRSAAMLAEDTGLSVDVEPGVDTPTGLLHEIWQVFWPAIVHRHPELAYMSSPQHMHAMTTHASPAPSIPSTVVHEEERMWNATPAAWPSGREENTNPQ